MPEKVGVRVRRLPDGEFHEALETSLGGRLIEISVTDEAFPLGSLLEFKRGSMLYWGDLVQLAGSTARIWIEHSLDRSKLQPVRDMWGE